MVGSWQKFRVLLNNGMFSRTLEMVLNLLPEFSNVDCAVMLSNFDFVKMILFCGNIIVPPDC